MICCQLGGYSYAIVRVRVTLIDLRPYNFLKSTKDTAHSCYGVVNISLFVWLDEY